MQVWMIKLQPRTHVKEDEIKAIDEWPGGSQ